MDEKILTFALGLAKDFIVLLFLALAAIFNAMLFFAVPISIFKLVILIINAVLFIIVCAFEWFKIDSFVGSIKKNL